MADTIAAQQSTRAFALVVCCAVLAFASSVAWAAEPVCSAKVAASAAVPRGDGEKFRLISQLCPTLAEPAPIPEAAQMKLYDKPSVTIEMGAGAPAPAASAASAAAAKAPLAPPTAVEQRILAIAPALSDAARAYDIDPLLMHAVAHVESRHNARAVSPAGARGVMQVMPATGERFGVPRGEHNLLDPATNLRAAAKYLRTLVDRYGHDLKLVLAAYNAGEGAVAKYGNAVPPYPETQAYVRDVLAVYRRLTTTFTVSRAGTLVARGE